MSTEAVAAIDRQIAHEHSRGEFAYWGEAAEAEWRAKAPPKPEAHGLRNGLFPMKADMRPNQNAVLHRGDQAHYATWEGAIAAGKSYLVGESVPTAEFIAKHRSPLTDWQKQAYRWCMENPYWSLLVSHAGKDWVISAVVRESTSPLDVLLFTMAAMEPPEVPIGYVVFRLPHHDAGGEKSYVTRDGKTKVLVDDD